MCLNGGEAVADDTSARLPEEREDSREKPFSDHRLPAAFDVHTMTSTSPADVVDTTT